MKRLEHVRERKPEDMTRRDFFRLSAAGAGLIAALQVGSFATALLTPRAAIADQETRQVSGRRLNIIRLDKTIAEMDTFTRQYRETEILPTQTNNMRYSNAVAVPNDVRFVVGLEERVKGLVVTFPRDREQDPSADGAGTRSVSLLDFARYIRRLSGQDMSRVWMVIERGTFQYNGADTTYTNAYIFPLNADGRVITRQGSGEYVVYYATYYANVVAADSYLIIEPNNRDTIARR